MTCKSRRRSAICLAAIVGLCLSLSNQLKCDAFVVSAPATGEGTAGVYPTGRAYTSTRTRCAVRSRDSSTTRVFSAVEDVERTTVRDNSWTSRNSELLPLGRIDPEIVLFGTKASAAVAPLSVADVAGKSSGSDSVDPAAAAADVVAAVVDDAVAVPDREPVLSSKSPEELVAGGERIKKTRRKGGKAPVVVEGDDLANTPKMIALVWSSLSLNALYLLQAFLAVGSPVEALGTAAAGAFVGYLIADLWSGLLHWSLDNYGSGETPAFGAIIESFQGHHASPWTITHRPFENNVHKVTYAALPLLALLRLADPGLFGVALGVAFLYGSLMSNEFHKYSHMLDPPPMAKALQGMGLSISRKQHGRHHSGIFDEKYCLVSGICNGPMDDFRVFRFLERVVYETKGVEPIAWRLDPSLKEVALSTGWWPFGSARVEAAAATAEEADEHKAV